MSSRGLRAADDAAQGLPVLDGVLVAYRPTRHLPRRALADERGYSLKKWGRNASNGTVRAACRRIALQVPVSSCAWFGIVSVSIAPSAAMRRSLT